MGAKLLEAAISIVLTAALGWACYWVWEWVPTQAKGTPFSSFGIFTSVLAVFLLLSLADLVLGWLVRLVGGGED